MVHKNIDIDKSVIIKLPSIREMAVILSIGIVLGYIGPFGSYDVPIFSRLIFWVLAIAIGQLVYSAVFRFCYISADKSEAPFLLKFFVGAVLSATFLTFILAAVTGYFLNFQHAYWEGYIILFPQVLLLGFVIGGFIIITNKNLYDKIPHKSANVITAGHHFLNRLPVEIGKELICFVMEDHYLRIYTAAGEHLLLHRMKDALLELDNYDGIQVHRSWWIALGQVEKVKKENRKAIITMKNGIEVPVSEKYLPMIKQAGLS